MKRSIRFSVLFIALAAPLPHLTAQAEPRFAPVQATQRSEEQRALAAQFERIGMQNLVATLLRYPELARAVLPYTAYLLTASALPERDRELLWLRSAWLARSSYVWAQRAPHARAAGVSAAELARIAAGPDAPGWSPFDAALLRAADELHVDAFITNGTWRALAARYDEAQLIDLFYGAGEIAMLADIASTLRIDIEAELTDRLPDGIPYNASANWRQPRLIGEAPRIAPLDRAKWSAEVQQLLDPRGTGRPVANVFQTFVRNPPADALRNAVGAHIRGATSLMPRNRQLLIMRTATFCRSEYEWAVHARIGQQVGFTAAEVARILAGSGSAMDTSLDAVLLRAADELHRDNALSEETWEALDAQLDERQLLDVLVTVSGYRSAAYAINSAGIQLDEGMEDFRFPPELR